MKKYCSDKIIFHNAWSLIQDLNKKWRISRNLLNRCRIVATSLIFQWSPLWIFVYFHLHRFSVQNRCKFTICTDFGALHRNSVRVKALDGIPSFTMFERRTLVPIWKATIMLIMFYATMINFKTFIGCKLKYYNTFKITTDFPLSEKVCSTSFHSNIPAPFSSCTPASLKLIPSPI